MPEQMNSDGWGILRDLAQGSDEVILERLGAIYARGVATQSSQHPLRKPDDPTEVVFLAALARGFTEEERKRWASSPYCARLLKLHWRSEPPSPAVLVLWEAGELTGFEAAAMKEHLEEPEGQQSRMIAACIRKRVLTGPDHLEEEPLAIRQGEETGEPATESAVERAQAREAFLRLLGNVRPVVYLWWWFTTRDRLGEMQKEVQAREDQLTDLRARTEELSAEAEDVGRRLAEAEVRMRRAYGLTDAPKKPASEKEEAARAEAQRLREQEAARAEAQRLREQLETVKREWETARVSRAEFEALLEGKKVIVKSLQQRCTAGVARLPESFRRRISPDPVSDWLTTTYPTLQEVTALLASAYPALQHVQGWRTQTSPAALAVHLLLATGDPWLQSKLGVADLASGISRLERLHWLLSNLSPERHEGASGKRSEDHRESLRVWSLAHTFIRQLKAPAN
jgi:hypothetical protein